MSAAAASLLTARSTVSTEQRSLGLGPQSPTVCLFPLSDFTPVSHAAAECVLISMDQSSDNDISLTWIV